MSSVEKCCPPPSAMPTVPLLRKLVSNPAPSTAAAKPVTSRGVGASSTATPFWMATMRPSGNLLTPEGKLAGTRRMPVTCNERVPEVPGTVTRPVAASIVTLLAPNAEDMALMAVPEFCPAIPAPVGLLQDPLMLVAMRWASWALTPRPVKVAMIAFWSTVATTGIGKALRRALSRRTEFAASCVLTCVALAAFKVMPSRAAKAGREVSITLEVSALAASAIALFRGAPALIALASTSAEA